MRWRAARLLVAAGATLGSAIPSAAAASPQQSPAVSTPVAAVSLHLGTIRPVAPQPGDTLRLTGSVQNGTDKRLPDLAVALYLDPGAIGSRGAFESDANTPETEPFGAGLLPQAQASTRAATTDLAPGASTTWSIKVPVGSLGLTQPWEVYQMGVAATSDGVQVGRLRTFLPYAPVATTQGREQLRVAWLWPLVDRPHRRLTSAGPTFSDDQLARSFATGGEGGRLQRLAAAAEAAGRQHRQPNKRHPVRVRSVPVTYAVDPMLLDEARQMSKGYTVHPPDGAGVRGKGKSAAAGWLSQLAGSVGSGAADALALPYGDPDISAAVRAGDPELVQVAATIGDQIVSQTLGRELSGWAWPPGGMVSDDGLNLLFDSQITGVVLDPTELSTTTPPSTGATPNAHVVVPARDGDLTGLLPDAALSAAVTAGAAADSGLALQRYLSETLMIQAEAPYARDRAIVIAPAARWSPDAAYARRLLADTGQVPWMRAVRLPTAATAPPNTNISPQLRYPAAAQSAELPEDYVHSVAAIAGEVGELHSLLGTRGAGQVLADDEATLAGLSSAWQGRRTVAKEYVDRLRTGVEQTLQRVHIAASNGSFVTLTSHAGAIPLTVQNGLDQQVHIRVKLIAGPRLSAANSRTLYTVPAHQQVLLQVHAQAQTAGVFTLGVRLLTPDRKGFGQPVKLFVHSTAYGAVTIAITFAALAVLFVAVGFRLTRRALRARRAGSAGDD